MEMKKIKIAVLLLLCCTPLLAQTADNVLVVLNEASPMSMDIGMYYAQKRGIPKENLMRVKTTAAENISREDFDRQIHAPIAAWLMRNSAQDRILYIVVTKGIPIRITGTSGKDGNIASVDSELTLLYRRMVGQSCRSTVPSRIPISWTKRRSSKRNNSTMRIRISTSSAASMGTIRTKSGRSSTAGSFPRKTARSFSRMPKVRLRKKVTFGCSRHRICWAKQDSAIASSSRLARRC